MRGSRSQDNRSLLKRKLKKHVVLAAVFGLLIVGCGGPEETGGVQLDRQRVILLSIDTLRADHLSCYGYHRPTSPFIDQLAARGVVFEHAIVQIPATLPSHMSMLTGLLPVEHDVFPPDDVLSKKIPFLPQVLAQTGVRTAGFTEGGYASGRFGFSRGFDRFDDRTRKTNTDVEDTFARAIDFLETIDDDEAFFVFVHTYAVHDPYFPPPPYCQNYLPEVGTDDIANFQPFTAADFPNLPGSGTELQAQKQQIGQNFVSRILPTGVPVPTGPNLSEVNKGLRSLAPVGIPLFEALYDGSINYVDDVLAAFFARLEELGLAETTTVILTSDHGEEFFEHGRVAHEQVYNECLQVPLIVIGPGLSAGGRVSDLVMSIDLMPTILALFGFDPPQPVTGRSLLPFLHDPSTVGPERDAYATAFVDPSESLYRVVNNEPHQVVVHAFSRGDLGPWTDSKQTVFSNGEAIEFDAMTFHEPREVEVRIGSDLIATLQFTPVWSRYTVDLPAGSEGRRVVLSSAGCVSPASLGKSADDRCLAFRLRGLESGRAELYNIARDPLGRTDLSMEMSELIQTLRGGLAAFHRQAAAPSTTVPLDAATEERLRALGYLD